MADLIELVRELSEIERKVLLVISSDLVGFEEVSVSSGVSIDSVRRACEWLNQKGLVIVSLRESESWALTSNGERALLEGMPENILLSTLVRLGGRATFSELERESGLNKQEFMAALGINKRKVFVVINNGIIEETGVAREQESFSEQNALRDVVDGRKVDSSILVELNRRGLVERKKSITRLVKISKNGEDAKKILSTQMVGRNFDVSAPVPKIFLGKKAPYVQFLQQIRQKLVALGFTEMDTSLITTEFYNFDVLFQPQNHPARTWTESYQLKNPRKGVLPSKKIVDSIRDAHENGGVSKSKGWGYVWDQNIATRLVPTMHGTAHSAKQLVKGVEYPKKYFAIARCFRPDVLDATHLIEFNQMEGFIVGEGLNFTHLLGMLKDFAVGIAGAEEVKFFPDYYPFTEPSVQLSAKHPEMGWIEFAGAGMFRPEMLENLGIKGEAIAWGVGVDRLAMFKLGIKDIRNLFSDDLNYLRNARGVLV